LIVGSAEGAPNPERIDGKSLSANGGASSATTARQRLCALKALADLLSLGVGELIAFRFRGDYASSMAATAYRYLINLPGVRGGRTIIEGTRIGVHDVVGLAVNGATVDDVVRSFPALTRAQIYECLAYYEDHRAEIDTLVARQMSGPDGL
jgi:uncharacterized protein (DUF433 family)